MSKNYYIGSHHVDGLVEPNHGWPVGKLKDALPRKNNTVVEILEPAASLTINAPSDPSAKEVLD